jgi:hypothetical protein
MASRPWLERLHADLRKRGLPPDYIERLMEEVSDHWDDLMEETMSGEGTCEARMGPPEELAEECSRRPGPLRRPLLAFAAFVVAPAPLLLVLWVGIFLAGGLALEQTGLDAGRALPGWARGPTAIHGLLAAAGVVASGALAALFGGLARRYRAGARWAWAAALTLALTAGLVVHQVNLSDLPGESSIALGVGLALSQPYWQVWQFVLALACGWLVLRRQAGRGRIVGAPGLVPPG